MRRVIFCHCEQCRRTSGHYVAATACAIDDLTFGRDDGLRWYRSSDHAERGFCQRCGANLFWRPDHREYISVMAGSLESPTGLGADAHIHIGSKSDYYAISDGLPQHVDQGDIDMTTVTR